MRQQILKMLSRRSPALLWTIFIFILLSLPGKMLPEETGTPIPNLDKLVHIILFGTLVFLWCFYFSARDEKFKSSFRAFLRVTFIACLYGIAMEYVQKYFIPNRDFDLQDIMADVIGAFAGLGVVRWIVPR